MQTIQLTQLWNDIKVLLLVFLDTFICILLAQTMEQHFETERSHILNFQGYLQHHDQIRFTGPPETVVMHPKGLNMALRLTALPNWNIS